MTRVYLSLGSNIDRHKHIRNALHELSALFGHLVLSTVYESEAVGFAGDHFYNLVVGLDTDLSIGELQAEIKRIEDDNGRVRGGPKFSSRTLDIDILTYGDFVGEEAGVTLPRDEITKNAFVLLPLSEVAPDELHPELNKSFQTLWEEYDKSRQKLWPVQL
ncbi:MAG: 2-amino-4-hydroxy-6-hydroxymethyldihydropteridine diphosphokinase [Ketobacteraceae bacterium]|nr:2-amino-4-hydroxy-6-hydroxymethyldihydropteridine diphosphokinase [Ketobacteraceae bacterium]